MSPMQSIMELVIIDELPRLLAEYPDENTHAIIVDDPLNPNEPLIIPSALKGVTSHLPSRKPKTSDYEDEYILHIDITSKAPVCEPSEISFSEKEDAITDFRGEVIRNETIKRGRGIINYLSTRKYYAADFTDDDNFIRRLTLG